MVTRPYCLNGGSAVGARGSICRGLKPAINAPALFEWRLRRRARRPVCRSLITRLERFKTFLNAA
jgi:hypothetical protein